MTFEEWHEVIWKSKPKSFNGSAYTEPDEAWRFEIFTSAHDAGRVEALRELAKTDCAGCRKGQTLGLDGWHYSSPGSILKWPCSSLHILSRIAEIEKKAPQVGGGIREL